jgi:hypothetical protein
MRSFAAKIPGAGHPAPVSCEKVGSTDNPWFKILFLSHGKLDKGITDALECIGEVLERHRYDVPTFPKIHFAFARSGAIVWA